MPVKSEANLLRYSLPSCYRLNPAEVLLCVDYPPTLRLVETIRHMAICLAAEKKTRIVAVHPNASYKFHQAWVRREGFRKAAYDRILTTDADLILNRNALKAVSLVGDRNIGLASCTTLHSVSGWLGPWRAAVHRVADFLSEPGLMGLYALWRPYWSDSEDDGIKRLPDLREGKARGSQVLMGEDIYLRNCMRKKHATVHLRDVGAYNLRPDWPDRPYVQFELGRFYAESKCSLGLVALRTIAFARPHLLRGYFYQRGHVACRQ